MSSACWELRYPVPVPASSRVRQSLCRSGFKVTWTMLNLLPRLPGGQSHEVTERSPGGLGVGAVWPSKVAFGTLVP